VGQAKAFLNDDEAHNQIKQLKERLVNLEESVKQQSAAIRPEVAEVRQSQIRDISDLQKQIDYEKIQLKKLLGDVEMLSRNLQNSEDRQIKFYNDLTVRVKKLEQTPLATMPIPAASSKPAKP
jgi:DNA-binding protein H-NS